jgi:hypothetical protein
VRAQIFTRRVAKAVDEAEAQFEPLSRAYERLIRDAGKDAAQQLTSMTAAADWSPPPEGTVLDPQALAVQAVARLRAIHERILETVAGAALLRTEVRWDIAHPLSKELLAKAGLRTGERLTEAVQPILREVITAAYAEGLSVKDTAERIRLAIRDAAPWQAEMLARTDLVSLSNGGSVMAAKMVGMPYKQWQATLDAKTREEHADADGQIVPMDQPFDVGGELLDYPGDPAGSDANVANCRCTVLYADDLTGAESILAGGGNAMSDTEIQTGENIQLTAAAKKEKPWNGTLVREGVRFEDGRLVRKGITTWREPPLSLMALTVTDDGHKGAVLAGRIDEIWRDGDRIRGRGVFNNDADGERIAARVKDGSLRGISVDFAVQELSVMVPEEPMVNDDGSVTMKPAEMDFVEAVIGMATVCPFQANEDAQIELVASAWLRELEPLTASGEQVDERTAEACRNSSDFFTLVAIEELGRHETLVSALDFTVGDVAPSGQIEEALANLSTVADLSSQIQELGALVTAETQRADYAEHTVAELEQEVAKLRAKLEAAERERKETEDAARAQIAAVTAQFASPRTVRVERDEDGRIAAVVKE